MIKLENNYKSNFTVEYASDIVLEGNINLPYLLLRSYAKLGLNEIELTIILHLIALRKLKNNEYPTPEELATVMSIDSLTIKSYMASLIEISLVIISIKKVFVGLPCITLLINSTIIKLLNLKQFPFWKFFHIGNSLSFLNLFKTSVCF